eukprot:gene26597-34338_t
MPETGVVETLVLPVGMAFGENFCEFSTLDITLLPHLVFGQRSLQSGLIYGGDTVVLPLNMSVHLDVVYCRFGRTIAAGQFLPNK